jgi:hypothetical protein
MRPKIVFFKKKHRQFTCAPRSISYCCHPESAILRCRMRCSPAAAVSWTSETPSSNERTMTSYPFFAGYTAMAAYRRVHSPSLCFSVESVESYFVDGFTPSRAFASTSWSDRNLKFATPSFPASNARSNGVFLSSECMLKSAPLSRRSPLLQGWPLLAVEYNGVPSLTLGESTSAPLSIKNLTTFDIQMSVLGSDSKWGHVARSSRVHVYPLLD